jgi:hypothetical protein
MLPRPLSAGAAVRQPSLTVFELAGDRYAEAARVTGDEPFGARRPFPVDVVPSALVAGLRDD